MTQTQDLVMTRVFDAPRELVYRAFVDPDQIAAWFGPVGWSVPRDTISVDWDWRDKRIKLFDTAGMRKKARIDDKLNLRDKPHSLGRANAHGAPSLALCQKTRAVAIPIDHAGELYIAFHPLSNVLRTVEANHQYYESEHEFVETSTSCVGDHPLALIAERSEAIAPSARLLAAQFRCTQ